MIDKHKYKGWLNSDSFIKRAFAIFGYNLIPTLIFWGLLVLVGIILTVIIGFSS